MVYSNPANFGRRSCTQLLPLLHLHRPTAPRSSSPFATALPDNPPLPAPCPLVCKCKCNPNAPLNRGGALLTPLSHFASAHPCGHTPPAAEKTNKAFHFLANDVHYSLRNQSTFDINVSKKTKSVFNVCITNTISIHYKVAKSCLSLHLPRQSGF